MAGIGNLVVFGPKAAAGTKIPFKVEFSAVLVKKLKLSQATFSGDYTDVKTRQTINLRAKVPDGVDGWGDLRTILPCIWRIKVGEQDPDNSEVRMWEAPIDEATAKLKDYMWTYFVTSADGLTAMPFHVFDQYHYKMHPALAKLYGLPENFTTVKQTVKAFAFDKLPEKEVASIDLTRFNMTPAGMEAGFESNSSQIGEST